MSEDDMRAVVFTANTEDSLLCGLENIPGYVLSRVQDASLHPLMLTSPSGAKIYLRHAPGSTSAATTNILPQDHEAEARPFEQDEATKLSKAAEGMGDLQATLQLSKNDLVKLIR